MDDAIYLNHAGTSWPKPNWVADADQLLLTPGCTSSLSTAIASVDLPAGSRVLASRWEHHAVYGPLQKLMGNGVAVDSVPADHDSPMDLVALEQSLAARDVGLVAVTAACNVTGDLLPIEQIIELPHRYDAMALIDAAQIVGWVDLNFDELGHEGNCRRGRRRRKRRYELHPEVHLRRARRNTLARQSGFPCRRPVEGTRHRRVS